MDWSNILGILGILIGIAGLAYAYSTTRQFSKGVKIGVLRSIRTLIDRLEEDKKQLDHNSSEWLTMHHTQQNLEDLFKNSKEMFKVDEKKISDK